MKKWNATQLKYLMAAVMVLDHIPHITGIVSPLWEGIFHALTRCVGVWFAYMAMEGFIHTRNLKTISSVSGLGRLSCLLEIAYSTPYLHPKE